MQLFKSVTRQLYATLNEDVAGTAEKKTRELIKKSKFAKMVDLTSPAVDENGKKILTSNGKEQPFLNYIEYKFRDEFIHTGINAKFEPGAFRIAVDELGWEQPTQDAVKIGALKAILKHISETEDISKFSYDLNGMKYADLTTKYGQVMANNKAAMQQKLANTKFAKSNYVVTPIVNYEQSSTYSKYTNPSSKWCLTYGKEHWNSYTANGINRVYFCHVPGFEKMTPPGNTKGNNPKDEYGLSLICVIVGPGNELLNVTSRWNHERGNSDVNNADNIMGAEELSKLLGRPFYEVCKGYSEEEMLKDGKLTINYVLNRLKGHSYSDACLFMYIVSDDDIWDDYCDDQYQHLSDTYDISKDEDEFIPDLVSEGEEEEEDEIWNEVQRECKRTHCKEIKTDAYRRYLNKRTNNNPIVEEAWPFRNADFDWSIQTTNDNGNQIYMMAKMQYGECQKAYILDSATSNLVMSEPLTNVEKLDEMVSIHGNLLEITENCSEDDYDDGNDYHQCKKTVYDLTKHEIVSQIDGSKYYSVESFNDEKYEIGVVYGNNGCHLMLNTGNGTKEVTGKRVQNLTKMVKKCIDNKDDYEYINDLSFELCYLTKDTIMFSYCEFDGYSTSDNDSRKYMVINLLTNKDITPEDFLEPKNPDFTNCFLRGFNTDIDVAEECVKYLPVKYVGQTKKNKRRKEYYNILDCKTLELVYPKELIIESDEDEDSDDCYTTVLGANDDAKLIVERDNSTEYIEDGDDYIEDFDISKFHRDIITVDSKGKIRKEMECERINTISNGNYCARFILCDKTIKQLKQYVQFTPALTKALNNLAFENKAKYEQEHNHATRICDVGVEKAYLLLDKNLQCILPYVIQAYANCEEFSDGQELIKYRIYTDSSKNKKFTKENKIIFYNTASNTYVDTLSDGSEVYDYELEKTNDKNSKVIRFLNRNGFMDFYLRTASTFEMITPNEAMKLVKNWSYNWESHILGADDSFKEPAEILESGKGKNKVRICFKCNGTGKIDNKTCPRCDGEGEVQNCTNCNGTGRDGTDACDECGGLGVTSHNPKYAVCPLCEGEGEVNDGGTECPLCYGDGEMRKASVPKIDVRICPKCNGVSYDDEGDECDECDGQGYLLGKHDKDDPMFEQVECPLCKGEGYYPNDADDCALCRGDGVVKKYILHGHKCSKCDGTGWKNASNEDDEPCTKCKGYGWLLNKTFNEYNIKGLENY